MGILITGNFVTLEGYELSSVYCRLSSVACTMPSTLTITIALYVNRDRRIKNYRTITIFEIPTILNATGTLGDAAYYYSLIRTELQSKGFTVTDVFEETP